MYELLVIKGEPDSERKGCDDCLHLKGGVSWWCTNKEAQSYRGTLLPGVHSCSFWSPAKKLEDLTRWQKFIIRWFGLPLYVIGIDKTKN